MKKRIWVLLLVLLLTGCKKKMYTVTFMDEDNVLASLEVKKGDSIKNVNTPKKDGYLFVYWLKDGQEYDINEGITDNVTLVANWTKEPSIHKFHTVTFNYGSELKTQSIEDGEVAKRPEVDPKKDKYTFLGWYVGETLYDFNLPVKKDIILQAKYQRNRVIVKYDLAGGTGVKQVEIDKGDIPKRPDNPTKFGYDFINWTLDGKPYNFDFPLNEDVTIKANFSATVYVKVTFDTDGGNSINSQMLAKGQTLSKLPTAIKDGYTFKYWSYLGKEFDINTKIDNDMVLIAVYEEITEEE